MADDGPQALHEHEKPFAKPALRKSVMGSSRTGFRDAMLSARRPQFQDIPKRQRIRHESLASWQEPVLMDSAGRKDPNRNVFQRLG
jgi:hypothetical protein